jgi:hypothetical protein
MTANKPDRSLSKRTIRQVGASALVMILWTAGASAQQVQNGNFSAGTSTSAWSELGVANGSLTPQATGWTVSGSGIDCVMLSSSYTTSTPMCGTSYLGPSPGGGNPQITATLTQTPGPVPAGYVGNILVADAFEGSGTPKTGGFAEAISQTITGLSPKTAYSLSFYYSGAQQSGFSGNSADFWQVSYGASSSSSLSQTTTTPICVPATSGVGTGLCAGITSGSNPVWSKQTFDFTTTASGTGSNQEFISFLAQGNGLANEPPFLLLANVNLAQATPEPASLALLGVGLAGLAGLRRRARSAS